MSEMTKYARVSRVEDFFKVLLTKYGVSENIFVSRLPVTIKSSWNDMALIDVGCQGPGPFSFPVESE